MIIEAVRNTIGKRRGWLSGMKAVETLRHVQVEVIRRAGVEKRHKADMDKLNVNGGAIALGHLVGSTGARFFATALQELERRDREPALVSMRCGGSLGTAPILQRV